MEPSLYRDFGANAFILNIYHPRDSNSTCPTQSAPAASDTLKQDAVGSPALTQEKLPSMLADRNREDLTMLYTPRARRMREADRLRRGFNSSG
jgi:hypothetical protein